MLPGEELQGMVVSFARAAVKELHTLRTLTIYAVHGTPFIPELYQHKALDYLSVEFHSQ